MLRDQLGDMIDDVLPNDADRVVVIEELDGVDADDLGGPAQLALLVLDDLVAVGLGEGWVGVFLARLLRIHVRVDAAAVREDHRDDLVTGVGVQRQRASAIGDGVRRMCVDGHDSHCSFSCSILLRSV